MECLPLSLKNIIAIFVIKRSAATNAALKNAWVEPWWHCPDVIAQEARCQVSGQGFHSETE